ncbi:MAG: Crp/Fnr family transcriptional regulator [Terriglobia bacterium]
MLHEKNVFFNFEDFLTKLGSGKTILEYPAKQDIFKQGSAANAVFYIQKGKAKLAVVSSRGKEAVLGILDRDNFLGEGCLAGESLRMTRATAIEDCIVVRFTKETMRQLVHQEPGFSYFFMSHLLSRHVRIQEDLMDQLFNFSEKRLARTLLLLAHAGEKSSPAPVIPPISQETLAEMIGTTRSRVSLFMNKFRRLGFVEYSDGWKVNDSLRTIVMQD